MEYDATTSKAEPIISGSAHTREPLEHERGHVRVKGDAAITDVKTLAQPITFEFSGRTAKNRFLKGPMTERLCHWNKDGEDIRMRGVPSTEYLNLYRQWGQGEIGIVVAGNMMVNYEAVEGFGNPILVDDHDGRVEKFREVANTVKANGSLFIGQLSHPGRQGNKALNPNPVSASDIHLKIAWAGNEFAKPRALSTLEVKDMVKTWGEAAYWLHQAGFDGVQIHCAHGYLLAQFISQTTNKRTDEYGGDLTKRSRIVFEIIDEVRRRVPDPSFIICVKINSVEFQDKGTTPEDCKNICMKLEEARVDFVDLSGGTFEGRAFHHVKKSTKAREAYFIEFAEMIRPNLKKTKVYVTGGLRSVGGMARAIATNSCDGIGLARPLAAEPFLCKEMLGGRVTGAIESFMPLPYSTQSSGSQLHQIGHGDGKTSDWSVQDEIDRWTKANEIETERKIGILPKVDSSGYPRIHAQAGFNYLS